MLNSYCRKSFAVVVTLMALVAARPALAGPPLLCHPYDIAGARSLPWQEGASWEGARPDYPLDRLDSDTLALLAPATPIIVRMETLRRAAIYAARDPKVAARLFTALMARADAGAEGDRSAALASLDAAYYVEAVRQMAVLSENRRSQELAGRGPALRAIVQRTDGYALAAKALAARPGDPAMEFAAALISLDGHRDAYPRHAGNARAGVSRDALLAKNIDHVQ
jgi:hypothetical protein